MNPPVTQLPTRPSRRPERSLLLGALLGLGMLVADLAAQAAPAGTGAAAGRPATPPPRTVAPAPAGATTPQGPTRARVELDRHDPATSRRAFAHCDADRDDRLDLFEANDAIEALGDPRDTKAFARLDSNRDGFVDWQEFDQHFRHVVERGRALALRPYRPLPAPSAATTTPAATPLQRFFRLYDQNRNGGLDPDEVERLASQLGLLPMITASLRGLDANASGKIEEAELAPWFDQIQKLVPSLAQIGGNSAEASAPTALGAPWGSDDEDGNGQLDLREFERALRRLDPSLARWAAAWFARLDKNGDKQLDGRELGLARAADV